MCLTGLFLSLTCKRRPSGMEKRSFVKLKDFLKHYVVSLSLEVTILSQTEKLIGPKFILHTAWLYTILIFTLFLGNIKLIIEWVFLQSSKESKLNCLCWNHVFYCLLKREDAYAVVLCFINYAFSIQDYN